MHIAFRWGHNRHMIIYIRRRQRHLETHMIKTHIHVRNGWLHHQNYILRSARSQKLLKFLSLWYILIPVYSITNQLLSLTHERRVFFCALYNRLFERLWEETFLLLVLRLFNNHKQACNISSIKLQNMYLSSRTTISLTPSKFRITNYNI